MIFCRHVRTELYTCLYIDSTSLIKIYLTLKIDNVIFEKVDKFSFLGLTMDTNINWKRHSEKSVINAKK